MSKSPKWTRLPKSKIYSGEEKEPRNKTLMLKVDEKYQVQVRETIEKPENVVPQKLKDEGQLNLFI